jgi:hypothetical protein
MKLLRNFIRVAIYLGVLGSLFTLWLSLLAWLGISAENVNLAMALIGIPFMLWTGFTAPPNPFTVGRRGDEKSPSPQRGAGLRGDRSLPWPRGIEIPR